MIGHAEECHLVKEQMKKHSSNSKYSFVLRPSDLPTVQFSIALGGPGNEANTNAVTLHYLLVVFPA